MDRILFLTSAHPGGSGLIGAGEAVGEGNLRALLQAGYEVHVVSVALPNQSASPDVVAACASYTTLAHSTAQSMRAVWSNIARGSLFAPWLFARVTPKHLAEIRQIIAQHAVSKVWIEFPSSLGFAELLGELDVEYFVHDVVTQKVGRRPFVKLVRKWVLRTESRLLSRVSRCHVMSGKDAELVRQLHFQGEVIEAPPRNIQVGVVENALPVARILEGFSGAQNMVYFGNMRRAENHFSMVYFLLRIYPAIHRRCPSAQMWILGLGPRWSLRVLARLIPGVHVTGPVDDPAAAFSAAHVCVAPVMFGAGVKIKVLQMLDVGAMVIATPTGAEGVPASALLKVVPVQDFAKEVINELNAR